MGNDVENKKSLLNRVKGMIGNVERLEKGDFDPSDIEPIVSGNYEGDGDIAIDDIDIGAAIEFSLDEANNKKAEKESSMKNSMKQKAAEKRKEKNEVKKDAGVSTQAKQSKYQTRSDYFLSEPLRALNVILNHKETEIYKDGADPCQRLLMGHRAYGNVCKRNAFEHFVNLQKKLAEYRGADPTNAPPWIIFSNDTSLIGDRNIITRLEELKPNTGVAGSYGFERVRQSGRWFDLTAEDQDHIRGSYVQGSLESIDWDYVVGHRFKQSPKYRVLIAHGPFVAIRGSLFMQIDFTEASEKYQSGFWHYMAELSMECYKRQLMVATIKTNSIQYDNMSTYIGTQPFETDQLLFASRWQKYLPAAIPTLTPPVIPTQVRR